MRVSIHFTTEPITVPPLELPSREIGAVVEFHGLVREMEEGNALAGLYYEAYEPMARKQMEQIFSDLSAEHDCAAVTFIHRLGWAPVGESSIYLRVLASHRGAALALCGASIDRMKVDAPIWKRMQRPSS